MKRIWFRAESNQIVVAGDANSAGYAARGLSLRREGDMLSVWRVGGLTAPAADRFDRFAREDGTGFASADEAELYLLAVFTAGQVPGAFDIGALPIAP